MPLVNAADLLGNARDAGYRVASFGITSLDQIVPAIEAAERHAAPLILAFAADAGRALAPALAAAVTAARVAAVPVVIEARAKADSEAVIGAIRAGANSILLDPAAGTQQAQVELAQQVAQASGVPLFIASGNTATDDGRAHRELPAAPEAARAAIESTFAGNGGGRGRAAAALAACRVWHEIGHLIVYKVSGATDAEAGAMMARGREVLARIPGVRRVATGRAVRDDAAYRYCWLIEFAGRAVIDSYRDHPDHVAFANTHFRPVAGERISIDYEIEE